MTILVLGGTGAMGKHLVNLLAADENTVYVTTRKERSSSGNIHYIKGDAHDMNFLQSLLNKRFDCIVDFMVYTTVEFSHRVKQLLSCCGQYIYLSSSRVYADSKNPITEDSPRLLDVSTDESYLTTDEYALTKARQENLLFDSNHTNFTIIRPYITYSENRLQLGVLEKESWLSRALRGKTVVFSQDIAAHNTTMTYGLNVAEGIKALIGNEHALREVFHITQSEFCMWRDVWNIYKTVIEAYTEKEIKICLVDLSSFESLHGGIYQIRYDRLYDRVFDNSKISRFVDTERFLKPKDGLKKCLESFLAENGSFLYTSAGFDGRADRLTGEFSFTGICGIKNKLKYLIRRAGV